MEEKSNIFYSVVVRSYPNKMYIYLGDTSKGYKIPKAYESGQGGKSKKTLWFNSEKEAKEYIDYCGGEIVKAEFSSYCRRVR